MCCSTAVTCFVLCFPSTAQHTARTLLFHHDMSWAGKRDREKRRTGREREGRERGASNDQPTTLFREAMAIINNSPFCREPIILMFVQHGFVCCVRSTQHCVMMCQACNPGGGCGAREGGWETIKRSHVKQQNDNLVPSP